MSYHPTGPDTAAVSADRLHDFLSGDAGKGKNCVEFRDAARLERTRSWMYRVGLAIVAITVIGLAQMAGFIVAVPTWFAIASLVLVLSAVAVIGYRVFFGSGSKHKAPFLLATGFLTVAVLLVMYAISAL